MTLATISVTAGSADSAPVGGAKINLCIAEVNSHDSSITSLNSSVSTISAKQVTDEAAITSLQSAVSGLGQSGKLVYLSVYPGIDNTGVTDSHTAVQAAFNAAASTNKTIVWDCPVYCAVGLTNANAIFVPSSLSCRFEGEGVCITDGIGVPTFVYASNVIDVTWVNQTIKYIAGPSGAYGDTATSNAAGQPVTISTQAFNNSTLLNYMVANNANTFGSGSTPVWPGPTNVSAINYITGPATRLRWEGLTRMYVPDGVNASNFIPCAFSITKNWNHGVATAGISVSNTNCSLPTEILIEDLIIDGCYMGIVGGGRNVQINKYRSVRYSDIQTTAGGTVGGVSTWFAPPHALYITSDGATNLPHLTHIKDFIDEGMYVGTVTRRSVGSGFINSVKFEPSSGSTLHCSYCARPDGFIQILANGYSGGTITADEVYLDTSTLVTGGQTGASFGCVFPSGASLNNVAIRIKCTDLAAVPKGFPVQSDTGTGHTNLNAYFDVTVPDFPVGAAYAPGFGIAGTYNTTKIRAVFNAFTNTATTNTGVLMNQGSAYSSFSTFDVEIFGWRTLTSSNLDSNKSRILIQGSGATITNTGGNRVRQLDVSNQLEYIAEGGQSKESWSQRQVIVPTAGATYASSITFPASFGIEYVGWNTVVSFGTSLGLTGVQLGWSGGATAISSLMSPTTLPITTFSASWFPAQAPVSLGGSSRTLLLTAVGGTGFDGVAGTAGLSAKAWRAGNAY
jgi:hypothetical protein